MAIQVLFRAQGNVNKQAGSAIARRGSKLLVQYRIQDGSERERWISKDRYEADAAAVASLPERKALRAVAVLPDGVKVSANGEPGDEARLFGFAVASRFIHYLNAFDGSVSAVRVSDGSKDWHVGGVGYSKRFASVAEAEAEIAKRKAGELSAREYSIEDFERYSAKFKAGTWNWEPSAPSYSVSEYAVVEFK